MGIRLEKDVLYQQYAKNKEIDNTWSLYEYKFVTWKLIYVLT